MNEAPTEMPHKTCPRCGRLGWDVRSELSNVIPVHLDRICPACLTPDEERETLAAQSRLLWNFLTDDEVDEIVNSVMGNPRVITATLN